jgi:hypothetical protein
MSKMFVRAQTIFDWMMEESLARHTESTCSLNFTSWLPSIYIFTLCLVYKQERPESCGIPYTQHGPVPYPSASQQEMVQQESLQNSGSGFFSNCQNIVISGGTFVSLSCKMIDCTYFIYQILNVETPGGALGRMI